MIPKYTDTFRMLGPKYVFPRAVQVAALDELVGGLSKVNVLEAPVGVGKSPIALGLAQLRNAYPVVIATATLSLQEQYLRDFPSVVELKGRSNFPCLEVEGVTKADAPCNFDRKIQCGSEWYAQEQRVAAASAIVTNHALYATELVRGRRWVEKRPSLLVVDEAHRILDTLTSISAAEVDVALARKLGVAGSSIDSFKEALDWADYYRKDISKQVRAHSRARSRQVSDWMKLHRQAQTLFELEDTGGWITQASGRTHFRAAPVWPSTAAHALLASADMVLLMSATLWGGTFFTELLGWHGDYNYVSVDSTFNPERWPVYYRPVVALNKRSTEADWAKVADRCHEIMHGTETKGIIHVASNAQRDRLEQRLRRCRDCRGRLTAHSAVGNVGRSRAKGRTRADTLADFRRHEGGWIVHPNVGEGESFDHEQCRTQVIAKIRWPDLGDPLVHARATGGGTEDTTLTALGSEFYAGSAAAYTAQTAGRGMRGPRDYCQTYILDGSFARLYDQHRDKFPQWFHRILR